MPTYEYKCKACNAVYDLRQSFSAEVTHTCEECGNGVAKRVLHAPAMVFKGSGWYATDNRSKSPASGDGGSEPSEPSPAVAGSSKETAAGSDASPKSETKKSETKSSKPESSAAS